MKSTISINNAVFNNETFNHDKMNATVGEIVAITKTSYLHGADTYNFSASPMVHDDGVWCNDTCHRFEGFFRITKATLKSITIEPVAGNYKFDHVLYTWVEA